MPLCVWGLCSAWLGDITAAIRAAELAGIRAGRHREVAEQKEYEEMSKY